MKLHRIFLHLSAGVASVAFALMLGSIADAQVQIQINGQPVNVSPEPIMQDGRVFVPLRGVFESLGASVVYSNGQIDATGNGREISLHIGSTQATVDGSPQTIDVAPFIVGASTYVPLRFVSQALGASVDWDNTNHIVAITMQGAPGGNQGGYQGAPPQDDYGQSGDWISQPPPPLPDYETPPVPDPNYIWTPGYWAWGEGGYYYVPGTWVAAPQPGLVWTPGYWGWQNGYYGWHEGYWAQSVGYYGDVYYGGGYYGHGYAGGRWSGDSYQYNTAVVQVAAAIIRNVYVDRAVVVRYPTGRAGYNGGPHGIATRPTTTELAVTHATHTAPTEQQKQHVLVAGQDRRLLSSVNGGKPPLVVTPHALTPETKPAGFVPVTTEDKTAAQKLIVHPTPRPAVVVPTKTAPPREPAIKTPPPRRALPLATVRPVIRTAPPRPAVIRTAPPRPAVIRTAPPRPAVIRTVPPRPVAPLSTPAAIRAAPPRPVATPVPPAPVIRTAPPRPVATPIPPRPVVAPTRPPTPRPRPTPERTETPQ